MVEGLDCMAHLEQNTPEFLGYHVHSIFMPKIRNHLRHVQFPLSDVSHSMRASSELE